MSAFILSDEGIVINRTAAKLGKVPLAAWDIGTFRDSRFLSAQPDPALDIKEGEISAEDFEASWQLTKGTLEGQIVVVTPVTVVGQVNRRAAAILAPLLDANIIDTEVKLNQEADGRRCKVLYIYALLGVEGNGQVVREPVSIAEMRAYIALLACTMKVLNAIEGNPDHDVDKGADTTKPLREGLEEPSPSWDRLPGAISWDYATGSIGNIVNKDLINQLGSRTFSCLRKSGAELSKLKPGDMP